MTLAVSRRNRGKYRRKLQSAPKLRGDYNMGWRKLLWRIFHVSLNCLACGAEMKIKDIYTGAREREILKDLTAFKYYGIYNSEILYTGPVADGPPEGFPGSSERG